jgi:hypothetical protein
MNRCQARRPDKKQNITFDDKHNYSGDRRKVWQASVRALVNVTDATFNMEVASAMQEFVKDNTAYIKGSAIFGLSGLQSVVYRTIVTVTGRSNLKVCGTEQEAKDYLVGLE